MSQIRDETEGRLETLSLTPDLVKAKASTEDEEHEQRRKE